jgi:hypothetical protein
MGRLDHQIKQGLPADIFGQRKVPTLSIRISCVCPSENRTRAASGLIVIRANPSGRDLQYSARA